MMPVEFQQVEKTEEIADWLKICFNNLDGDLLTIEKIDFTRKQTIEGLDIVAKKPWEFLQKSVPEKYYTEDFELQASEWFKCPVKVTWI